MWKQKQKQLTYSFPVFLLEGEQNLLIWLPRAFRMSQKCFEGLWLFFQKYYVRPFNPNLPGVAGTSPLVPPSNLSKFHEISWVFLKPSKIEMVLAVSALFHCQILFFVYAFYWNNDYIFGISGRIWVQRVLGKNYIHFINNILPIVTVIINFRKCIWWI